MAIAHIHDMTTFKQAISRGTVLLDFWAPWCGPCKALEPLLEQMAERHPNVTFLKVNADGEPGSDLGPMFGVASLPTLLIFQDGKMVSKRAGSISPAQLRAFLDEVS